MSKYPRRTLSKSLKVKSLDKSEINNVRSLNVYGFGSNDFGKLGVGSKEKCILFPMLSFPLISVKVRDTAAGWNHTVFIVEDNTIQQVGNRVGSCTLEDLENPKKLVFKFPNKISEVACGDNHTLLVDSEGKVFSWGSNLSGQLGSGDNEEHYEPKRIKSFRKDCYVIDVCAGDSFSLCRTNRGEVYSWGDGFSGSLGHGNRKDQLIPKRIRALEKIRINMLAAGNNHVVAVSYNSVKKETYIYSWGWNGCGQLGLNDLEDRLEPKKSNYILRGEVISISCGAAHTGVVTLIHKLGMQALYMWGSNRSGQVGLEVSECTAFFKSPVTIPLQIIPEKIECGANHTVIICSDNKVYSTGNNEKKQLGIVPGYDYEEGKAINKTLNKKNDHPNIKMIFKEKRENAKSLNSSSIDGLIGRKFIESFKQIESLKGKNVIDAVCGGDSTLVLTMKEWINDSDVVECMGKYSDLCKIKFGVISRRHHCRNCGGIFCNECSNKTATVNDTPNLRVCEKCYGFFM